MRKYSGNIAKQYRALHFNGVNKRKGVRYPFKHPANKLKIKPGAGKPGGEVGEQSTAYTANLFIGQNTSEKQAKGDKENRNGYDKKYGIEDTYRNVKSEQNSEKITNAALCDSKRNYRQGIA